VVPEQPVKSIGHEETFAADIWDRQELQRRLVRMVDASATALRRAELAARTITIKVRFGDFTLITRSHSMGAPIDATPAVGEVAAALLDAVDLQTGVRLLGVSLSGFGRVEDAAQLTLDLGGPASDAGVGESSDSPEPLVQAQRDAERIQSSWGSVTAAVDSIRARYGGSSVGPASLVGADGLQLKSRGEAQWGPSAAQSGSPLPAPESSRSQAGPPAEDDEGAGTL
jgi:DNA polymerase-4